MTVVIRCPSGRNYESGPSVLFNLNSRRYLFGINENQLRMFCTGHLKKNWSKVCFPLGNDASVATGVGDTCIFYTAKKTSCSLVTNYPFENQILYREHMKKYPYEDDLMKAENINLVDGLICCVQTKELKGKLNAELVRKAGGGSPEHFKALSAGIDVIFEDGSVIRANDVKDPPAAPLKIVFINAKTSKDFDRIKEVYKEVSPSVVVHFTDPALIKQKEYLEIFMSSINFYFPFETFSCYNGSRVYNSIASELNFPYNPLIPLYRDSDEIPGFIPLSESATFAVSSRFGQEVKVSEVEKPLNGLGTKTDFGELPPINSVTVLGTSCHMACNHRNTSGYLVRFESGFVIMDPSQGTVGQILLKYGEANLRKIFDDLSFVFISHPHEDHHMGLWALIEYYCNYRTDKKLKLIIPRKIIEKIKTYKDRLEVYDNDVQIEIDGISVRTVPVTHEEAHSVRFDCAGTSFVYSGDRRATGLPIDSLGPCDFLLHEATFRMSKSLADAVNHTTMPEALEEAKQLKAKRVLLTHFSLRSHGNDFLCPDPIAFCAFDFVTVPFDISESDLKRLKEVSESVVIKVR